jgi:hypothetical protein
MHHFKSIIPNPHGVSLLIYIFVRLLYFNLQNETLLIKVKNNIQNKKLQATL